MMPDTPLLVHVTEVLDAIRHPELELWRGRVGNKEAFQVSQEAKKIGTSLHLFMKNHFKGAPLLLPTDPFALKQVCVAAQQWLEANHPIPLAYEETLTDADHALTGTPDLVTRTEVIDYKTASRFRWDHQWQVNRYIAMVNHQYHCTITKGRIVRLDKELGTFEEQTFTYSPAMDEAFLHLVDWYRYWKGWKEAYDTPYAKVSP